MDLEMVLNELSLQSPASDIYIARQWMSELINVARTAVKHGASRVLRTHRDFSSTLLAPEYPVVRWRNDKDVSKEVRQYFNSLATKAPFLADISDPTVRNRTLSSEFSFDGILAQGLGIAFLLESLAISVRSEQRWEHGRLELEARWLEEDGSLIPKSVIVVHASRIDHISENEGWIKNRLRTSVRDGSDLWKRRDSLFPSLTFCDSVAGQLQRLHAGNPLWRPIVKRLFELEEYCGDWKEGAFEPERLPSKASPESEPTLRQFGRERTFQCPDGQNRTFSWHVRLTPGAWRIHFFPGPKIGGIIIGYIGPHLPTVHDPT
jgi:hypothetical protein